MLTVVEAESFQMPRVALAVPVGLQEEQTPIVDAVTVEIEEPVVG